MPRSFALCVAALFAVSCNCGGPTKIPCTHDSQCTTGHCVAGTCSTGNTGGGGGSAGGTANTGGGTGGGGSTIVTGCDPNATDNASRDTDCDGLSDSDEYMIMYANGAHTDPCNSDTDGDGVQDGTEMGSTMSVNPACGGRFVPDSDPGSKTDPTLDDTDGDTLKDGDEDKNHDGKVDPGESNPLKIDSDCDGISDSDEVKGTFGCVTDPLKVDSDGDGLPDGVEEGRQMPGADPGAAPLHCMYAATVFDTDPATSTSACNPDSDGDGIQDGAEDANQNGKVDMGELDPGNMSDGTGPAQQACATNNLKPVNFNVAPGADVQVALVPDFAEVVKLTDMAGDRGLVFYDATNKVAGIAIDRTMPTASGLTEEAYGRGVLNGVGSISAPLTQTFTTWDGFATSVRASYDMAGGADLKDRANAIAAAFGVTGTLTGMAGITGPFKVQAEYVRRASTRSIILIAITPASVYAGQTLFTMDDAAGGSALAQFGDFAGVTCEVFDAQVNSKVDFLWAVDDSGSMASSQTAVSRAGALFAQRLASAGLDWRAAGVSSSYQPGGCSNGCTRAFTNDGPTMTNWFTQGDATAFGTSGNGTEMTLASAKKTMTSDLMPTNATGMNNKIRSDAQVHILVVGDVDDQSSQSGAQLLSFFENFDGTGGMFSKATVHGIVCPAGTNCGDDTNPTPTSQLTVINGTGGVAADIRTFNVMNPSAAQQMQQQQVIDSILSAVIGGTGHQLARPPISSTIKVAIETGGTKGTCNTADIPRDRSNGWDFDSATRKLVFYGNCIPSASGKKVAVSYRFWNDASPDPGGDPCNHTCQAPMSCNPTNATCFCPMNCGGACTGNTTCNMMTCGCDPGIG